MNNIFYLGHALVCFLPTLIFGWQAGFVGGLYIEGAQLDVAYGVLRNQYGWIGGAKELIKRCDWIDTLLDLICDAVGIGLAVLVKNQ